MPAESRQDIRAVPEALGRHLADDVNGDFLLGEHERTKHPNRHEYRQQPRVVDIRVAVTRVEPYRRNQLRFHYVVRQRVVSHGVVAQVEVDDCERLLLYIFVRQLEQARSARHQRLYDILDELRAALHIMFETGDAECASLPEPLSLVAINVQFRVHASIDAFHVVFHVYALCRPLIPIRACLLVRGSMLHLPFQQFKPRQHLSILHMVPLTT
ncbi:hybrid sensor histidine kinase/response regulator [Babesia caballi]|uniref:Hybrid sensor histidine kinase/response regulator n=1 Tax=Babesia caballi TaxID=5871 RepID=A0AAV4M013_BABCB|nr:hybrid sensor histidine kinase/response regulator [Babesia caballi]